MAPPAKPSARVLLDTDFLYARVPAKFVNFVLSLDGFAQTEIHGFFGSCSWILCKLPEWNIVIAASAYLSAKTVNLAEYTG